MGDGVKAIVLGPGGGRSYEMGRITATFKVDVPGGIRP